MTSFNNKSFALKEFVAPRLKTVGGLFITGPHNSLKRVEAPQLESIGRDALDNSALETVDFPLLKSVGGGLFNGSRSLNSVNLPSLETVGGMLFNGNAIKMLILPKLTTVEGGFCYSQSKLVYVDLGALELVSGAFIYDSPNIKTLIIRTETVPSIGGSICNKKPSDCILYVPDGMIEKYLANSKWSAAFDKDHIKSISEAPQPPA